MTATQTTRRGAPGAGAATLLLRGTSGAPSPLGSTGASLAQGLRKERWTAPSRITLLPGDSIIAPTSVAQSAANEKMLVGFLRAAARARPFSHDTKNELETIQLLGKCNAVEGRAVEKGKRVLELVRGHPTPPAGVKPIVNDETQWNTGIDLMETIGLIKTKGLPRERDFTNRFANQATV